MLCTMEIAKRRIQCVRIGLIDKALYKIVAANCVLAGEDLTGRLIKGEITVEGQLEPSVCETDTKKWSFPDQCLVWDQRTALYGRM